MRQVFSVKQFILEVDQIDLLGGSGKGRVEPFEVIDREGVLPEGVVDEDAAPLSALGLVSGHSVGVLELQGVVVLVFTDGFVAFLLGGKMSIVLVYSLVEGI